MFDFHFNVNADLSALEQKMSELQDAVSEVKAMLSIEAGQAAALIEKISALQAKVDALLSDTFSKAEVAAAFAEIKADVPNVVPDAAPEA